MEIEVLSIIDELINQNVGFVQEVKSSENNIISFEQFKHLPNKEMRAFVEKIKEEYKDDPRIDWLSFDFFYDSTIAKTGKYERGEEADKLKEHFEKKYFKKVLASKGIKVNGNNRYLLEDVEDGMDLAMEFTVTATEDLYHNLYDIYISEKKAKIKKVKDQLKSELRTLNDVKSIILKNNFVLEDAISLLDGLDFDAEKLQKLKEAIIDLKAKKDEKEQMRLEVLKLQKEKEQIPEDIHDIEPEKVILLNINNYEYLEEVMDIYGIEILDGITDESLNDDFKLSELKQIDNYSFVDVDDQVFNASLNSILYYLDKASYKTDLEMYRDLMVNLCDKYEKNCDYKDVSIEINSYFGMPQLTEAETKTLIDLQAVYKNISNLPDESSKLNSIQIINTTLSRLRRERFSTREDNERIGIKGFVLFDSQKGNDNAYVVSDLDQNNSDNMIDDSIDRQKIEISGYRDISDLVDIITATGTLGETVEKDPKLIRPVFKKIKRGHMDTSMANATGMYRIRPRNSSLARFIERKFSFKEGTLKHEQLKKIFEKLLPGAEIKDDFTIFINYLCMLKCKDLDPYDIVKPRYDHSRITAILSNKDKPLFNKEELKEIEESLSLSLETYKKLTEINSTLAFDIVNSVTKECNLAND